MLDHSFTDTPFCYRRRRLCILRWSRTSYLRVSQTRGHAVQTGLQHWSQGLPGSRSWWLVNGRWQNCCHGHEKEYFAGVCMHSAVFQANGQMEWIRYWGCLFMSDTEKTELELNFQHSSNMNRAFCPRSIYKKQSGFLYKAIKHQYRSTTVDPRYCFQNNDLKVWTVRRLARPCCIASKTCLHNLSSLCILFTISIYMLVHIAVPT